MSADKKMSLLAQARIEGWREGFSEASGMDHEDAFYEGQQAALKDAPSRLRWFCFGLVSGAAIVAAILL